MRQSQEYLRRQQELREELPEFELSEVEFVVKKALSDNLEQGFTIDELVATYAEETGRDLSDLSDSYYRAVKHVLEPHPLNRRRTGARSTSYQI